MFGYGENEASKAVLTVFEKASEILSKKLAEKCICLKLQHGTEAFSQFSEFWPILTTPTIHFISGAGAKICEPLLEEITEKDILQRIFNANNQIVQPVPNDQPTTSVILKTTHIKYSCWFYKHYNEIDKARDLIFWIVNVMVHADCWLANSYASRLRISNRQK